MLCKGNLAHGKGVGWCLGTAGEDGLCPAHRRYPLYRPGSRGSVRANLRALQPEEEASDGKRRRRKSTKNPATKGDAQ